jgi:hypothetical protein
MKANPPPVCLQIDFGVKIFFDNQWSAHLEFARSATKLATTVGSVTLPILSYLLTSAVNNIRSIVFISIGLSGTTVRARPMVGAIERLISRILERGHGSDRY